ncbi:MAG: Ig-like domain-containing protein [Epsilonproteobacteria bacterium]|nr:Ig-like domain-containing protein [Campylobacterota bacterium]
MRKLLWTMVLVSLSLVLNAKEINLSKVKGVDQEIITSLSPKPLAQAVKRGENINITFSKKLKQQNIKESIKLKYLGCMQTKKEKLKRIRDTNLQKCERRFSKNKNLKKSCKQCVREIYRCQKERVCKPKEIRGMTKYFHKEDRLVFNPHKKLRPGYYQVTTKGLRTEDNSKVKKLLYRFEVSKNQIESINFTKDEITLKKGENRKLTLQATYKDGTTEELTESINWVIGDSTLISVDAEGTLDALKEGETLLQAEYHGIVSNEVKITVQSGGVVITNTPPVIKTQTVETVESKAISFTVDATDSENDTLTFHITKDPTHGTLTGTAPTLTYTPTTNFIGQDSFSIKANDGKDDSEIVTILIEVKAEVIHGHTLPPEPDPTINNATLLGVDSNDNGVRDDVERWIYNKYKNKHPIHIDIAMQAARGYKLILQVPDKAKEIHSEVRKARHCEFYYRYSAKYFNEPILIKSDFDTKFLRTKLYFNTVERKDTYKKYDSLLSGDSYTLPSFDEEKKACDFNTSKYEE